jgi:hypothetical protein
VLYDGRDTVGVEASYPSKSGRKINTIMESELFNSLESYKPRKTMSALAKHSKSVERLQALN